MKPSEVAGLLRTAARTDRWIEADSPAVISRWHELIGGEAWLTPALALAALDAFQREESRTVTPADILRLAREIRRDRLARRPVPDPPAEMRGTPEAYLAAVRAAQDAIVAGRDPDEAMAAAAIEFAARPALEDL